MADNNLTSSISALITQIKSEIPNANAENLKRLARSVRKLGHSGDNEIDTLINSRANALTATATTEELQTIAEAINQVDDTSNPTGATNTNADVHVSDTAPASAVSGDLWWKTDDLNLYIYYEDTDGAQWIQANSTVVAGAVPSDVSDLTDTTGLLGSGGATVYANFGDLPTTNLTAGDMAFVNSNNTLFITNGTAWFGIALTQDPPNAISNVQSSYSLSNDGTATVITANSSDPEGFPLTWSFETSSISGASVSDVATITQNNNVFTITPSTDSADVGEFTLTITASDGVSSVSVNTNISLAFGPAASSVIFTTEGTHSWVVPDGLTSISAVAVGAGGSGGSAGDYWTASGGSGGGLAWMSNISVTPGDTLYIKVAGSTDGQWGGNSQSVGGLAGADSWISYGSSSLSSATRIIQATGGGPGGTTSSNGLLLNGTGTRGIAIHGTEHASTSGTTSGGGSGGLGGADYNGANGSGGSGGGAGGYTGQGGDYNSPTPTANTGAGAAESYTWNGNGNSGGRNGGGVGVYGKGRTGTTSSRGGSGGDGTDPTASTNAYSYGGGGQGRGHTYGSWAGGTGGAGAVRIIWGDGRSYPDTNTTNAYNVDPETTV